MTEKTETKLSGNEKRFFELVKKAEPTIEDIQEIKDLITKDDIDFNKKTDILFGAPAIVFLAQRLNKAIKEGNGDLESKLTEIIKIFLNSPKVDVNQQYERGGMVYNTFVLLYDNEELRNIMLKNEKFNIDTLYEQLSEKPYKFEVFDLNKEKNRQKKEFNPFEEIIKNKSQKEPLEIEEEQDIFLEAAIRKKIIEDLKKEQNKKKFFDLIENYDRLDENQNLINTANEIKSLITNKSMDINQKNKEGSTFLNEAIKYNRETIINFLLDQPNLKINESLEIDGKIYNPFLLVYNNQNLRNKFLERKDFNANAVINLLKNDKKQIIDLENDKKEEIINYLKNIDKQKNNIIKPSEFNFGSIQKTNNRPNSYTAQVNELNVKAKRQTNSLDPSQQSKTEKSKIEEKSDELSEKEKVSKLSEKEKKRLSLCNDFITLENKFKGIKKNLETLKREEEIKKIENKIEKVREKIEQKVENNKSGYKTKKLEKEMSKITEAIDSVESKFSLGKQKGSQQIG